MLRKTGLFQCVLLIDLLFVWMLPCSFAQTKDGKQFVKDHGTEMRSFMEKCSQCHGLQRILEARKSKAEWDRIINMMAGKPHADISEADLQKIGKWLDFMRSTMMAGP